MGWKRITSRKNKRGEAVKPVTDELLEAYLHHLIPTLNFRLLCEEETFLSQRILWVERIEILSCEQKEEPEKRKRFAAWQKLLDMVKQIVKKKGR
ncbi:MAG: hypothetical protein NC417_12125 [Candidatus Gastranaerophilales bacterium]|nr:hypothetical protein [Candidatus Gastranaerophilales bacterium]